jgi:hypothetical protein
MIIENLQLCVQTRRDIMFTFYIYTVYGLFYFLEFIQRTNTAYS